MSGYAYQWAKRQQVGDSSTKTLLKTYAHWASEDYTTWVTNDELIADTELDIKTIRKCRDKLIELGFLSETERRLGATRSIVVYQMMAPAGSVIVQSVDQRTGETISLSPPAAADAGKTVQKRSPSKTGSTKKLQKRSPSKNGAPPDLDSSPSAFTEKPLQIRPEAPPLLDTKKGLEEKKKKGDKQPARRAPRVALHNEILNLELPDSVPFDSWDAWCEHREAKAKSNVAPWTMAAAKISLKKLAQLAAVGQHADLTIDEAVLRGWTGLFPINASSLPAAGGPVPAIDDEWSLTIDGIKRKGDAIGVKPLKEGEIFMRYKARVFKAAGPGPWMERMLAENAKSEDVYNQLFAYFNDVRPEKAIAKGTV